MLTPEEKKIMDKLVEAHNLFVKLPIQHPQDIEEWVYEMHSLQRIIMSREAVRANPELYYSRYGKPYR